MLRTLVSTHCKSPLAIYYCFLNPFANHSYFTVRALCQHGSVFLFCPPLQIQMLLGKWRADSISLLEPPFRSKICLLLALIAFFFFKVRLISEASYLSVFRFLAVAYLSTIHPTPVLVYYQDYLSDVLSNNFPHSSRICELIINSNPSQPNYNSTLRAIQSSTSLVIPTSELISLDTRALHSPSLAPYGGDKALYLSAMPAFKPNRESILFTQYYNPTYASNQACVFQIVARAPSQRKGLDILLHSLLLLDTWLATAEPDLKLQIVVCGKISELTMHNLFSSVSNQLSHRCGINLICRQFSPCDYMYLLSKCDLFIMPSRLESASLAALEALWHGVPSILTHACGISNFSPPKHGLLLNDMEPTSLSLLIQSFIKFPDRLRLCREHLAVDRHMFTWNHYFNSYSKLLSSL